MERTLDMTRTFGDHRDSRSPKLGDLCGSLLGTPAYFPPPAVGWLDFKAKPASGTSREATERFRVQGLGLGKFRVYRFEV